MSTCDGVWCATSVRQMRQQSAPIGANLPVRGLMAAQVVIVGGGFSGATAAVQLVRRSTEPVKVTIIEPRAEVGRGLAYSADDPDHRLNATVDRHTVDPDDPQALARWIAESALLERDPAARLPDGRCYPRRKDFGSFVAATVLAHARLPNGSTICHLRSEATGASADGRRWRVQTAGGDTLEADLVIVATGNPTPRLPSFVSARAAARHGVIGNPMDIARVVGEIRPTDRVCVLGSGLTALDVISTLLRVGHAGPITAVSRRGLRPHAQAATRELPSLQSDRQPFDAPGGDLPDFIADLGSQPRMPALLRALRDRIRKDAAQGLPWLAAFGQLRDSVWRFWPTVPESEKRRFMRHLKVWYDVHRFLSPPQNEAMVQAAIHAGKVRFRAARVQGIDVAHDADALEVAHVPRGQALRIVETFDALINCTGIDGSATGTGNPFLRGMLDQGWLQPGPAGLGYAVDDMLCAIGTDGLARSSLRVIGPPSVGACGDPIGAGFIALQWARTLPDLLATLRRRASSEPDERQLAR